MSEAVYCERNLQELGEYYTRHVSAMTEFSLRSKSAIAAELAHLDKERDDARAEVERMNSYSCKLDDWNDKLQDEVERLKADKARILEIVAREVALEDRDKPGDCRASHNRANNISDAIDDAMKPNP